MLTEGHQPPLAFTLDEFATMIGFHPQTVRRWARAGTVRFEKIGGRWFIGRHEVEQLFGTVALAPDAPSAPVHATSDKVCDPVDR